MYVQKCVIIDGKHYGQPDCSHEMREDETGEVIPPGWTVQSGEVRKSERQENE